MNLLCKEQNDCFFFKLFFLLVKCLHSLHFALYIISTVIIYYCLDGWALYDFYTQPKVILS